MQVVATVSVKGGVGKTATVVNLAAEATGDGARVLVWDLDPQGSATYLLRAEHRLPGGAKALAGPTGALTPHVRATVVTGLHVVPADLSLRFLDRHLDAGERPRRRLGALLEPLADGYDLVVLDCPPGASLAVESAIRASDLLLTPVVPTTLAMLTLAQLEEVVGRRGRPPALVAHVSMLDRRKRLHREITEELLAREDVLRTLVPSATAIERMGPERAPVRSFAPRSRAAAAYRELWQELRGRLWA